MKKKLIVIVGKSASGKDTIKEELCKNGEYNYIIPYTTRPKRIYESNGKPYYFIDMDKFFSIYKANAFLAVSNFNGWRYGIAKAHIENTENPIVVADNVMLPQILSNADYDVSLLYIERNKEDRYIAQILRGCDIGEIYRRAIHDDASFVTIHSYNPYIIDNNHSLEETMEQVYYSIGE